MNDPSGAERDPESTYPFVFGALWELPEGTNVRFGWRDADGNVHWYAEQPEPAPAPTPEQRNPVPVPKPKRKG